MDMNSTLTQEQHRAAERMAAALQPVQDQLSLAHLVSLLTVATHPGLSVNELAERVGAPQATASRYVSVLLGRYQGQGTPPPKPLIAQEISPDDPRKRALFLSQDGQELVSQVVGARLGAMK
ncbi:hypothetical protein DY251_18640 [Mesorhizobium denitrificans]|uniref:HTH iclR-type domain-containing protein n=2 Tax=Mesorhizobium denitrificans TaxID=2294114 RepID=A0A371X6D1_9HYPH|nr:hypothetical protein DY251_18640 [Mesorhizobium denitrificans]